MLDLITINEGKKLQQQQLKKVILQPTDKKKINGKVYGFVMAWRNVISKNADQARSPQKSYENYHGKSPHSVLRAVDRMFISRGSNRKNDKCKLIAWFELLFDFETMSSVCNFCCPSLFCYTKIGFNFLLALFSHNNFFPRLPLQHVWVKSCMWTTCGYHLPLRFLLRFEFLRPLISGKIGEVSS